MTGESHIENLKAGGGAGFQNPATSNLLMAGFDILNVQNITSPDAPSDGVDAGNFSVQAGSAVGTTTADGGRLGLYGIMAKLVTLLSEAEPQIVFLVVLFLSMLVSA